MIKAGIIGLGRIGRLHLENIIKNIPNAEIKAVADINKNDEILKWVKSKGIDFLTDNPKEIFEDSEIEAILITTPTDTHTALINQAIKANKHIFCEKPIGNDIKEIRNTLKNLDGYDKKFMLGFNRRYDHNFKRARNLIDEGVVGIPHIIKITSRDPAPPPLEFIEHSGGLFFDMSIHDWDMACYLAKDNVSEIYATGGVLIDPKIGELGDIDTAAAILKFKNGAMALIDNSRQAVYGYDQRIEVFGSKGSIVVDNEKQNSAQIYTEQNIYRDKIPYFFLDRYMQSYTSEIMEFFNCIRENEIPSVGAQEGLNAVLIALAAKKSLEENRPIKLDYFK
ncbi:MAG: inositol 2-dehydrogenase [Promethearchaeota archaeon]